MRPKNLGKFRNLLYEQKELLLARTKQTIRGREIAFVPGGNLIRKQDLLHLAFSSFTHYRLRLYKID